MRKFTSALIVAGVRFARGVKLNSSEIQIPAAGGAAGGGAAAARAVAAAVYIRTIFLIIFEFRRK